MDENYVMSKERLTVTNESHVKHELVALALLPIRSQALSIFIAGYGGPNLTAGL